MKGKNKILLHLFIFIVQKIFGMYNSKFYGGRYSKDAGLTKGKKCASIPSVILYHACPMKKYFLPALFVLGVPTFISAVVLFFFKPSLLTDRIAVRAAETMPQPVITLPTPEVAEDRQETGDKHFPTSGEMPPVERTKPFTSPIADASRRVTKKPFGFFIQPGHSPVPNDRFSGYHVGVDFETFENEQETDVAISAICTGPLLLKKYATGYGGVAVQECTLENRTVSVTYGHLNLASIARDAGEKIAQGERIGSLGDGYSPQTDGVRKHLHLGVREASAADIRGYVKDESEISTWLDPLPYMAL